MAENLSRESYQIDQLSLEVLNTVFKQIQDRLDEIQGLRGETTIHDVVNTTSGIKHTDEDDTIIHGFGDI